MTLFARLAWFGASLWREIEQGDMQRIGAGGASCRLNGLYGCSILRAANCGSFGREPEPFGGIVMMVGSTLVVLSLMLGPAPTSTVSAATQPGATTPRTTTLNLRLSGAPVAAQAKDAWQRQMNAARARKDSGKKLMIFGGIAAVGGTILGVAAVDSCVNAILYTDSTTCGGQSALSTVGWLVSLGGDVTFVWGLVDFIGANGEIASLNSQRSGGHDVAGFNLSPKQRVALQVGRGANVAYKVRW